MKTYKKFLKLIKEGLIRTHNIYNYSSSLRNNLLFAGFEFDLTIENKFRYIIIILNPEYLDENYNYFISLNNNYGFYPIQFKIIRNSGMSKIFSFDDDILKDELKRDVKEVEFLFDAKYDDSSYKNNVDVPDKVYHLSPSKNRKSMLNSGFYPKSNSRKVNHKDRLYIFSNIDDYENILKSLKINDKFNNNNYSYDLYEIQMDKDKNILHIDPDSTGYFTYDHISPKNIKIFLKIYK